MLLKIYLYESFYYKRSCEDEWKFHNAKNRKADGQNVLQSSVVTYTFYKIFSSYLLSTSKI